MKQVNWSGVFPAVTTKFKSDDSLDLELFSFNIEAQLNAGVNGIILGGTLGEASALSVEEKNLLLSAALDEVDGKVPVIMNVAEQTTKGAIAAAENARNLGADGLMMLPPMRYKADERETFIYFEAVAQSTDLPIMIYNNPVDYGVLVTLDIFEKLAKYDNVQAVKESTRDLSNVTRMKSRFDDRFKILSGVDTLALESLLMGADGWVAGLVCAFPKETVAIYQLVKAGRMDEAIAIYRWFLPLLELDINAKLVQNIKLAEVANNLGSEHVRAPRLPLVGEERDRVLKIVNDGIASRPELPAVNLNALVI